MKIMTYNIRGLGGRIKRKVVKQLVKEKEVEMLCIQESKLEIVDLRICKQVWGDSEVEWKVIPALNSAGGIITMWNKGDFSVTEEFLGVGVLGLKGV